MFTHPALQHHLVRPLPDRAGYATSTTDDFETLGHAEPDPSGWIPYCEDESDGRLVCATGVDAQAVASQGLHYAQLRSVTRTVVRVPADIVPGVETLRLRRHYIFCPGRCGSTLLCQLLRAAGLAALAEPGFYLQVFKRGWGAPEAERIRLRHTLRKLEYLLLRPFEDSTNVVVKPHPYCAADTGLFLGEASGCAPTRTIALLRRVHPWSHSWSVFNQTSVGQDLEFYIRYLGQLEQLTRTTQCLVVSYEELVSQPHATLRRIGAHLQVELDLAAIGDALKVDAHVGERPWTGPSTSPDPARETLLNTLWRLHRPDELIARLGIGERTG